MATIINGIVILVLVIWANWSNSRIKKLNERIDSLVNSIDGYFDLMGFVQKRDLPDSLIAEIETKNPVKEGE